MVSPGKPLLAFLLLAALAVAGCAQGGGGGGSATEEVGEGAPEVEVTETTGGIRGVVVDDAIRPIADAKIQIVGADDLKEATSDANGLFAVSGLEEGTYLLKASHPLYAEASATAEVKAGVKDPDAVKMLLTRTVFAEPFYEVLPFDGFIVCSTNVAPVGYSEECGEGAGSPKQTCDVAGGPCVPNPIFPGERIGGQSGNNVQFDFFVREGIKTSIVELHWKPTSEAGRGFFTHVDSGWACDPFCSGNPLVTDDDTTCRCLDGESPLYGRIDEETLLNPDNAIEFDVSPITVFTWASMESSAVYQEAPIVGGVGAGTLLNQAYKVIVTNWYYLPAPDGWTFVGGSKSPYGGN